MSDRDDVRGLAEEIARSCTSSLRGEWGPIADRWAARIRAFLAERDENYARDLHDWRRGVELIASALGEVDPPDLSCARLSEVALALRAEVEEQSGRVAALREALEAVDEVCRDSFRDAGTVADHRTVPVCPLCSGGAVCDEECPAPDVRRALATDAGKLEAEVLRAAVEFRAHKGRETSRGFAEIERLHDAVDALQAAKETS